MTRLHLRLLIVLIPFTLSAAANYADPTTCATCHTQIAETYSRTGMGRSFFRPSSTNEIEDFTAKPFHHAPSDLWYSMLERDGALYQRRWQIGQDGKEDNVEEKRVDYVLGSGNHGRTYLHLTARHTLQQLPLGWYAEKGGSFAMNPGYDKPDHPDSIRAIAYKCMFCHNAYPEIPKAHEQEGAEAQFTTIGEGIDCQRCHGPGQKHVEAASRAGASKAEIRAAITNPARLSPEREMEVCLQCHLESTSRPLPGTLQRKGRTPFSYLPGQPLSDFRLTFDRAKPDPNNFEVAQAGYRFLLSQCYLKSPGKLQCTTCHNPHDIPRGEAAIAGYNAVCRNCHKAITQTAQHSAAANCVACHMPKRRTDDAVHIVMTDHRIQRHPPAGDLLADKPELRETPDNAYRGEVVPFYPSKLSPSPENALDQAIAQIKDGSNIKAGLPQLASLLARYRPANAAYYYEELAEAYRSAGDAAHSIQSYEQALQHSPASPLLVLRLGNMLMEAGQLPKAEAAFRRALRLAPDDPLAQGMLGWVLSRQGSLLEATAAIEKGIELDPELPELRNYLGAVLIGRGDRTGAEQQFLAALAIQPNVAEWQANLGNLLASRGRFPEAAWRLRQSLHLKPNDIKVHVTYTHLLFDMGHVDEAGMEIRATVEQYPGSADAHECLAFLLSARGDANGAERELQTAVNLQPAFGLAQFELGVALWQRGDTTAARKHLDLAAQSSDLAVKSAAKDFLQKTAR